MPGSSMAFALWWSVALEGFIVSARSLTHCCTSPPRGWLYDGHSQGHHSYDHTLPAALRSCSLDLMQSHRAVHIQEDEVFLGLLPIAASQSLWHLEVTRARHLETTA